MNNVRNGLFGSKSVPGSFPENNGYVAAGLQEQV